MNADTILDGLRELEPIEKAGLRCFRRTGRIPDFFQVYFLMSPNFPDGADDEKGSGAAKAAEAYQRIMDSFSTRYAAQSLSEDMFMPEDANIELQKLQRYVDIIPHRHDFFEVVCMVEGSCLHTVEQQEFLLQPGDITIIPPQLPHHLAAEPDCVCITVKMRASTFDRTFSSLLGEQSPLSAYFTQNLYTPAVRSALTFQCGADSFVREHLLFMYGQQQEKKAYCDNIIESTLSLLFSYLLQNYQDSLAFSHPITQHGQRIAEILNYLRTNYKTATLSGTAERFYLNAAYLSASIRRFTGRTFSEILRACRLRRAAELLIQGDWKLDDICEEIGYRDTTQFIRSFKAAYGCTPRSYRNAARANPDGIPAPNPR